MHKERKIEGTWRILSHQIKEIVEIRCCKLLDFFVRYSWWLTICAGSLFFSLSCCTDWSTPSIWTQSALLLWCLVWERECTAILLLVGACYFSFAPVLFLIVVVVSLLLLKCVNLTRTNISFGRKWRLDVGEGKEVNLEKCPRNKLQQQCIEYRGPV